MAFKLCSVENVKRESKTTIDVSFDTLVARIIDAVTLEFARLARRPDWDLTARTVFLTPDKRFTTRLFLASPPVAASPAIQVWENADNPRVYGTDELLTLDEDYFVMEEDGILLKEDYGFWTFGIKTVKVTYTGGLLSADATGVPEDLRDVAIDEVLRRFLHRDRTGFQSESLQGSSVTFMPDREHYARLMRVIEHYRVYPTNGQ